MNEGEGNEFDFSLDQFSSDLETYRNGYEGDDEEFDQAIGVIKGIVMGQAQYNVKEIPENREHFANLTQSIMNGFFTGPALEKQANEFDVSLKGRLQAALSSLGYSCEKQEDGKINVIDIQPK